MRQYITTIINSLTNKNPSVSIMEERVLKLLKNRRRENRQRVLILIEDIKNEISLIKDFRGERDPFYHVYLAVAYFLNSNYKPAKHALASAIQDFQISDTVMNVALGEWLFSIIHYKNEDPIRSQQAYTTSTSILGQLIKQNKDESKYAKAGEYATCLLEIEEFGEMIKAPYSSNNTKNKDFKAALRVYYEELKNKYDSLRLQKKRVPPILVASKFYIYKILVPSHSVYPDTPDPANENEKKLYDELLNKVGFFEVIEQLIELESEFEPTATREELLEIINSEWNVDIR
jgi:hypothetical protein